MNNILYQNNQFQKYQIRLIYIFLFSSLFSLISFGKIASLSLTPTFLVSVVYFLVSIFGLCIGQITISFKRLLIFFLLVFFLLVSFILSGYNANVTSTMLYLYYFSLFLLVDAKIEHTNAKKWLSLFVTIIFITALYGIYQFFAYNVVSGLPFKEIIPTSIWVSDMNVLTTIHGHTILGKEVYRIHSIYAEPSIFSQFCSIAILLLLALGNKEKRLSFYLKLLVLFVGLIVSLSGTGIIILLVGLISYFIMATNNKKFIFFTVTLFAILSLYLFKDTDIVKYFFGRSTEISDNSYSSGYYRFFLPFKIGFENMNNTFLGFGPGNDNVAFKMYDLEELFISNGFGKIFVEIGIFGLLAMVLLIISIYPKHGIKNKEFFILFFIVIVLNIVGTFMAPTFWAFALFLTVSSNNKKLFFKYNYNICEA